LGKEVKLLIISTSVQSAVPSTPPESTSSSWFKININIIYSYPKPQGGQQHSNEENDMLKLIKKLKDMGYGGMGECIEPTGEGDMDRFYYKYLLQHQNSSHFIETRGMVCLLQDSSSTKYYYKNYIQNEKTGHYNLVWGLANGTTNAHFLHYFQTKHEEICKHFSEVG
jgi:hypothetical protein